MSAGLSMNPPHALTVDVEDCFQVRRWRQVLLGTVGAKDRDFKRHFRRAGNQDRLRGPATSRQAGAARPDRRDHGRVVSIGRWAGGGLALGGVRGTDGPLRRSGG